LRLSSRNGYNLAGIIGDPVIAVPVPKLEVNLG
jgi:hypothetical protein